MSLLRSNLTGCTCQLNSPLTAPLLNLHPVLHPTRASSQFRVWRRRRRLRSIVVLRCQSVQSSPLETLMQSFVSQFPSVNSLDLIAPALGFASGLALFFLNPIRFNSGTKVSDSEGGGGGDCMLLTSPTAFNRFVVLRCPCISFQGNELLNLNEKLLKEDTHFVRIRVSSSEDTTNNAGDGDEEKLASLEYQRVCVDTDDGGVISLDWPAHLDLRDERGLDTTLLLIPGTAQGSMDINIRSMVRESLQQGCFPIVINPRGCAGSPLTTPRLFTAADSDDICTAINFINRERPWATLMAVGWGYGANILTKYLGEVGDRTPLNAATCIDNPFDLQEATRSSHHYIDLDQKLTGGLIDILQSNKELFQGRAKGFNVEKALLSKSIRDFDEAISMISNGYDALGDFYAACSTRDVVMNVKIPVLFIQNNDGPLPLLSIPQGLIAENPFTSLLVYCFSPSQIAKTRSSSVCWSHHLSIEWLMAVELGLLKGRHPLLKDIDVTVSPSTGGAVTEVRESVERGRMNKLPNVSPTSKANGYVVHPPKDVKGNGTSVNDGSKIGEDSRINSAVEDIAEEPIGTVNIESAEQGPTNERGQVLQTADVVMNVLDVTMPGTLTEERKKKALTAVAQGETVMKALQDAVPEDVREKLTTAVSKVVNDEGTTKKFDQLVNASRISDVASGLTSKIQKKEGELSSSGENKNHHSSEQKPMTDKVLNDNQVTEGKPTGEPGTDLPAPATLQKPASDGQLESTTRGIENSSPVGNDSAELDKIQEKAVVSTVGGDTDGVSDTGAKPNLPKRSERTSDSEDKTADNLKADHDGELAKPAMEVADNIHQNVESATNSSSDQKEVGTNKDEAVSDPSSSSEPQLMESEGSNNLNEENQTPSSLNQSNSDAPNLNVTQAFDALTGMDDSTQVAVNSVFGVIEDMITKLEVEKEANGVADGAKGSEDMGIESDNHRPNNDCDKSPENTNSEPDITDHHCMDEGRESVVTRKTFLEQNNVENSINTPLYITSSHYNDPLYNRYLQTYLLPKMPNSKALDLDGTTSLFLDYIPEEGRWKLLEPAGRNKVSAGDIAADKSINRAVGDHSLPESDKDKLIEPPYVIMDAEKQKEMQGYDMIEAANATVVNNGAEELRSFIKNMIIDTLKFEVQRKLGDGKTQDMELLSVDMEQVADTVIGGLDILRLQVPESKRYNSNKLGTLNGEQIIRAISSALPQTNDLRRVLPVGVAVGASLAALRRFFDVAAVNGIIQSDVVALNQIDGSLGRNNVQLVKEEADEVEIDQNYSVSQSRSEGEAESEQERNDTVMAGCVTAALGASALLVNQQDSADSNDIFGTSHKSSEQNSTHQKDLDERDEESGKNQNNMVASLAEKAMSVAAPVVPTKEDGGVDQERLVAMLAEWGQKGGMLRLVGKVALLWGGMRGAMSLTYKLISFLRIAERPLIQRILGFVCMVLVLWSPVVVPLLPTVIQGWTTHNTSKFTELICLIGLYVSTMILVMLWGKRIRGYENPFQQYGLDIISLPKIQNLLKGLVGGVILVVSIHSLNVLLGCVQLSWPSTFVPFSPDAMSWLKVYCRIFLLVSQGIITATGIAVVEELLFRSWLPDEIAEEFGHHRAVIISGLAFSVFQRSPLAVPGLWLLSLSLSGAKQRSQGSLSIPIGLRAGIMASSYVLQTGGFLTYQPNFPLWVTGTHPFQPFSGVAGFTLSLLLAIVLYPRQLPSPTKGRNMLN